MEEKRQTLSKKVEKQIMYSKSYGEEMKHDYYYYEDDIFDSIECVYGVIVG